MIMPIVSTKIYIPPPRPKAVLRPRLTERLNEGLHGKLSLISASAGFGKTTLVSEWLSGCGRRAAWLSLDDGDNDPARFLTYLCAALQTAGVNIGEGVFAALQSPGSPSMKSILTVLLNEITALPHHFVLVLDDYHVIDAKPVDDALAFVLERMPDQMHLVIATREDPRIPLARLRARGQLNELRVTDLRFSPSEAAGFLNGVMNLNLSAEDIARLETRTEGWIAGLQLAAISMQGHTDAASFIHSFTGSHRFVLDYLVEEVLQRQSEQVQTFLLRTSILDRLCGPLCDAVLRSEAEAAEPGSAEDFSPVSLSPLSSGSQPLGPFASGQEVLEYLETANLFIVPLDNERRWYRYHHLFADLLRQRLQQSAASAEEEAAGLHLRASVWYEEDGLEIEAFKHAAAANDVDRAARLMEGGGMPLFFRGAAGPVLSWLESLRPSVLNAEPSLLVAYASVLLFASQINGVEQKLQSAEAALQGAELDDKNRDLVGHIAAIRATLAVSQHQLEAIIVQSQRALEYLHPDNLPVRTATTWTLGYAYQLQGDRAAATRAFTEAISTSQAIGHFIITIMAATGLGNLQEAENQLQLASATYRQVLQLAGDPPLPVACEAHLGLARIGYQWNDLESAEQHWQQSDQLAQQIESTDRFIAGEVFLSTMKLAGGDTSGAAATLAKTSQLARQHNFMHQMPEIAAAQVMALLRLGNLEEADRLAGTYGLPLSQARVHLARGDAMAALAVLEPLLRQAEAKGWENERLKAMVLQAVALHAHGETGKAARLLGDVLALAEPGGFIRIFVDEGDPMAELLHAAAAQGIMPDYTGRLLAACKAGEGKNEGQASLRPAPAGSLIEPLSGRELEILQLIAQGLSNDEISSRLFLALSTVKGHNRNIYGKLQVLRRTEAVARARELGLL
ncbi:LuxR C-terminal-related transcriptional regulator [Paenibacillus oenotherae]|uniref:LuxR C-terminal-related transcriptional regulator n=1 Tax=Paenibacillus oenotherae TaxID=1435645 RepID=A0ABS7D1Z1_9BACL|nr:LuxR C-terminal-related transcriptional regulator [Paenibacillus oenotherae]MBW7473928.1 LuxR C-terminal-related transcriptional regulator [Paenibacillus oenotherae]